MVNTKFWSDTFINSLDPSEKLVFLYFLTNPYTNLCGAYEIPLKQVALDTGLDRENIEKTIIPRFEKAQKIYYFSGWVYVKNFLKYQKASGNIEIGIANASKEVPPEIFAKIKDIDPQTPLRPPSDTPMTENLNLNLNLNLSAKAEVRKCATALSAFGRPTASQNPSRAEDFLAAPKTPSPSGDSSSQPQADISSSDFAELDKKLKTLVDAAVEECQSPRATDVNEPTPASAPRASAPVKLKTKALGIYEDVPESKVELISDAATGMPLTANGVILPALGSPENDCRDEDTQSMFDRLTKKLKTDNLVGKNKTIRNFCTHLACLEKEIGSEEFWRRFDTLQSDNFHSKKITEPDYLYRRIRGMSQSQINWSREWYKFHVLACGVYADEPAADASWLRTCRGEKYFLGDRKLSDLLMDFYFDGDHLAEKFHNANSVAAAKEKILKPEGIEFSDFENVIFLENFEAPGTKVPLVFRQGKKVHPSWAEFLSAEQVKFLAKNNFKF